MNFYGTDPVVLASQARGVIQNLHSRSDVVVRFKTNESAYEKDHLDALDEQAPGHFKPDSIVLTLNLDTLITKGKPHPDKLDAVEDWRKYPVLAGVAAHESAHAKWSLWDTKLGDPWPDVIPNPEFDPAETDPERIEQNGPEFFPVSETGKLQEMAHLLEEPRVERLADKNFSKTWQGGLKYSASHLTLESIEEADAAQEETIDAAVRMAILVGGRQTAGTLGFDYDSRAAVKKVLDSAQKIIETAVAEHENPVEDPFHKIMGIINRSVFSNDHTSPMPHLEAAREILAIVHPETKDDPDSGQAPGQGGGAAMPGAGQSAPGEGEGEGEGEGSESATGVAKQALSEAAQAALEDLKKEMTEAFDGVVKEMRDEVSKAEDQPQDAAWGGGYGATVYNNPLAPKMSHSEAPNADDQELYRRAKDWMERQIQPTVTSSESGQWLPTGGARLNVRSMIRDNFAGRIGAQRTDWDRVSETIKPAPPVKVAIMLDGSGSMGPYARMSASIGWAAANAAADLPESRTASVVYGAEATLTQDADSGAPRMVNVSATNGPWENFKHAAELIEDALEITDENEYDEDQRSNVLIVIVSDLQYGRDGQFQEFDRKTKQWRDQGYTTVVVGASQANINARAAQRGVTIEPGQFELVTPQDLFR